jgi:lipoprotein NlpD
MRYRPNRTTSDQARPLSSIGVSCPVDSCLRCLWCLLMITVLGGGCSSTGPAPVDSRDASGPVPSGYHRVRPGENLYRISAQRGLDYQTVARWNGIRPPYRLYAGRLLRIAPPEGTAKPASRKVNPEPKASPDVPAAPPKAAPTAAAVKPALTPPPATPKRHVSAGGLHWIWPLHGKVVQTFRPGDRTHQGIRIEGRRGEMVVAAEGGKVVYSGSGLKGYGNLIIVKHNNNYLSAYGFNRRLLVKEGEQVRRGQSLAEVGQVPGGDYLLHFEIRKNGTAVNPLAYLPSSR